jgi:iron(III) transport system substrate-binding protein
VENRLATGPSAQIPLSAGGAANARVETPATVRAMPVDFESAAQQWDSASEFIESEFLAP